MANTKSARKAAKKAAVRTLRNKMWKSVVKTAIRKVREAATANSAAGGQELLSKAFRIIDKAAAKGILHANNAARKKARLSKRLASMSKPA